MESKFPNYNLLVIFKSKETLLNNTEKKLSPKHIKKIEDLNLVMRHGVTFAFLNDKFILVDENGNEIGVLLMSDIDRFYFKREE